MAPERKQAKKVSKHKAHGGGSETASVRVRIKYMLAFGAVAMVGVAAFLFTLTAEELTQTSLQMFRHLNVSSAVGTTQPPVKKVPTYDEYVKQAEADESLPTDPVQRLEAAILKYKQFDTYLQQVPTVEAHHHFLAKHEQELQGILEVLSAASDRSIDLTSALHHAIDIIPGVTHMSIQALLKSGYYNQSGFVLTHNVNMWCHHPINALQKLLATQPSHITANVNKSETRDAILVKIVKHRIYAVLGIFLHLGASTDTVYEALRVAVIQGDDLAVSMFFGIAPPPGPVYQAQFSKMVREVGARVPELLDLAKKLGFRHIADRLIRVTKTLGGTPGFDAKVEVFWEFAPYQRVSTMTSKLASIPIGARDPLTGFSPFQLDPVHTVASNGFDSYINQCAVDRVDIANLTVQHFNAEYVALNRPVVITNTQVGHSTQGTDPTSTASLWTLDNLVKQFGSTMQVSSTLPYNSRKGHTTSNVSLQDFITHPGTGMHAYTRRLQQALLTHGTALNAQQLVEVAASVGLPQYAYIFTSAQQNTSNAIHEHILRTVQEYSSSAAPAETATHLLELFHAASRGYTSTITTPLNEDEGSRQQRKDFKDSWKTQWYIGPALSGAPFHNHSPAFNVLMHGKKEWTLMPPARDLYTSLHPVEWLREGGTTSASYLYPDDNPPVATQGSAPSDLRTDQPCKLVQSPGEVLFVPNRWSHQVLNLAESVGFTVEVDDH